VDQPTQAQQHLFAAAFKYKGQLERIEKTLLYSANFVGAEGATQLGDVLKTNIPEGGHARGVEGQAKKRKHEASADSMSSLPSASLLQAQVDELETRKQDVSRREKAIDTREQELLRREGLLGVQ
jgi:hypothetical protein